MLFATAIMCRYFYDFFFVLLLTILCNINKSILNTTIMQTFSVKSDVSAVTRKGRSLPIPIIAGHSL